MMHMHVKCQSIYTTHCKFIKLYFNSSLSIHVHVLHHAKPSLENSNGIALRDLHC